MGNLNIGDIVARKSYGCDVLFKIVDIQEEGGERIITLKGISYRIQADAPEFDLLIQSEDNVSRHIAQLDRIIDKRCRDIIK
jgi:spore coat assemly protein